MKMHKSFSTCTALNLERKIVFSNAWLLKYILDKSHIMLISTETTRQQNELNHRAHGKCNLLKPPEKYFQPEECYSMYLSE